MGTVRTFLHGRTTIPRGSVLIVVLILLMVLFIMGMTLLGIKSTQAKSAMLMKYAVVARYIAEAGMEDARIKLIKDLDFPPRSSGSEHLFTYEEELQYPGDSVIGEFVVTIDTSRNDPALSSLYDSTILVTSMGIVKDERGNTRARHRIKATMDTSPVNRYGPGANPCRYKFVEWQDHGYL
jgi:hypothetical protein